MTYVIEDKEKARRLYDVIRKKVEKLSLDTSITFENLNSEKLKSAIESVASRDATVEEKAHIIYSALVQKIKELSPIFEGTFSQLDPKKIKFAIEMEVDSIHREENGLSSGV